MTGGQGAGLRKNGEIETLIGAVARGNRTAFSALYEVTSPKLFGCAMRILNDAQKSADAVQEAYLQIWRHATQFDAQKGAGEAWMVGILRFRAIDIARRDRTRSGYAENIEIDEFENMDGTEGIDPMPETMIALRDCLGRMGQEQRRALLEIHLNGYTGEEYAALHQIPLGTVKSRVRRGLQNLRICMEQ